MTNAGQATVLPRLKQKSIQITVHGKPQLKKYIPGRLTTIQRREKRQNSPPPILVRVLNYTVSSSLIPLFLEIFMVWFHDFICFYIHIYIYIYIYINGLGETKLYFKLSHKDTIRRSRSEKPRKCLD